MAGLPAALSLNPILGTKPVAQEKLHTSYRAVNDEFHFSLKQQDLGMICGRTIL
jgi:hypothetical protein